jgi:hypothetical protein
VRQSIASQASIAARYESVLGEDHAQTRHAEQFELATRQVGSRPALGDALAGHVGRHGQRVDHFGVRQLGTVALMDERLQIVPRHVWRRIVGELIVNVCLRGNNSVHLIDLHLRRGDGRYEVRALVLLGDFDRACVQMPKETRKSKSNSK